MKQLHEKTFNEIQEDVYACEIDGEENWVWKLINSDEPKDPYKQWAIAIVKNHEILIKETRFDIPVFECVDNFLKERFELKESDLK